MFEGINLLEELKKEEAKNTDWNFVKVEEQIDSILKASASTDEHILSRLNNKNKEEKFKVRHYYPSDIFSEKAIEQLCEKYRLRFLDSHYFNGRYPYEAIEKIKSLELNNEAEINNFFVLAPSKLFKLEDAQNDPLLFTKVSDDAYLLIHQWGSDLKWWKKIIAFPARSYRHLAASIAVFAVAVAMFVPDTWIGNVDRVWWTRFGIFLQIALLLSAITVYTACLFQKNFSKSEWRSKYFNE